MKRFTGLTFMVQSYEGFLRNTFTVPWPEVLLLRFSIIKEKHLYSGVNLIMSYTCILVGVFIVYCIHKYQAIWERIRLLQGIGKELDCFRELIIPVS